MFRPEHASAQDIAKEAAADRATASRFATIESVADNLGMHLTDWRVAEMHNRRFEMQRALSLAESSAREVARLLKEEMERI